MAANKKQLVTIKLHDGSKIETEVENYDAKALADDLTNEGRNIIAVGEVVVHRSNVASIVPVKE